MTLTDPANRVPRAFRRPAMTLVESVVAIAITSVLLVAALTTLGATARARQVQAEQCEWQPLAAQLMNEILQARYEEPSGGKQTLEGSSGAMVIELPAGTVEFGPEAGENGGTRLMFDDVDDYLKWSASPPQAKDGTPLADYAEYTRTVTVEFADPGVPSAGDPVDLGLKRITVTVTNGGGVQATLVALRSKVGAFEREPGSEQTYVSWIGFDLQVGDAASKQIPMGAALPNEPQGP